jgi:aspartyl-tRNA(Asn)/glutamyl-tRNA(Gln) amidotransferase subunit A
MKMPDEDISNLSAIDVALAIVEGRLSSAEVTKHCLDRIEKYEKRLNCIAGMDPEAALEAAQNADNELASGRSRGPLHGVPLAHKDMFYRAGRLCACGSRLLGDFIPDQTATVLTRIDQAGALDIARLNMVEFGLGPTGHNEITGTPHSPWNEEHITGGSSSGPAGAVAARLIYGALGSDSGGSVRIPAACCGLVGMKPSYGRVSRFGAMPLSFSLDHIGPLARTVSDCALLTQIIAGHDPRDPTSDRRPVPNYLRSIEDGIRGLRVGIPNFYFYDHVEPEVLSLMEDSLDVFRGVGAEIVEVKIPSNIDLANPMLNLIMAVEAATIHKKWLRERKEDYGSQTLARLVPGLLYSATDYLDALNLRQHLLTDFSRSVFDQVDLLHTPTLSAPVPKIADIEIGADSGLMVFITRFTHCTRPINYLGLPALSVPAGFTENGLPNGFQLVGRPFDEAPLFRAARAYERETSWVAKTPQLL